MNVFPHHLDSVKYWVQTRRMAKDLNTKKHHHGDLKKALVRAGIELLSEGGIEALTVRKCASRSGVSHAAPAHHFKGLKGLQTAIVTEGFRIFSKTMIAERDTAGDEPHARLIAIGNGYLKFSKNHDALAELIFMKKDIHHDDPDFQRAASAAYQVLADACAPFKPGAAGQKGTEVMIWSLVQGYANLARSGRVNAEETPFAEILPLLDLKVR